MNLALASLLSASLLCSSVLFAQGSTQGALVSAEGDQLEPPRLSAGERISYALLFPGATHFKLNQESRGGLYLGLTSAALLTGVSLVTAGYAKERAYLSADASPMQHREAANSLYEKGNQLLWVATAVWAVSIFDAWLGERPSVSAVAADEDAMNTEAMLRRPAPLAAKPKPAAAKPEPVAAKPKPAAAKPQPVASKVKPTKPKPATDTTALAQSDGSKLTSTPKVSGGVLSSQGPKSTQAGQLVDPFEEPAVKDKGRAPEPKTKELKELTDLEGSAPDAQGASPSQKPTESAKQPTSAPKTAVIVMFDHTPKGRFSLQLRAFKKEKVARRYLSKVAKKVGPLRIFQAMHKGSPLFRVRLGRFNDRAAAEAALTKYLRVRPSKGKPIVVSAERDGL